MRRVAIPILITVLLTGPALGEEMLGVRAGELQAYAYRNSFGETEHYLAVGYKVSNPSERSAINQVRTTMLTGEGKYLNDGYRPLVLSAFCREYSCEDGPLASTAEVHGRRLGPGESFAVLALFRVPGDLPESVRLRVGEAAEISYRKVDGAAYARVEPRSPRSVPSVNRPEVAVSEVSPPAENLAPEAEASSHHLAARLATPIFP